MQTRMQRSYSMQGPTAEETTKTDVQRINKSSKRAQDRKRSYVPGFQLKTEK